MGIRITEDGVVNYENSPDVNRKLFPNLNICGKEIDELAEEIDGKAPAVFSTASGSIASFDDGADNMPLKECVVSFEPIQEGEGDPSPENVRPISGRTGLTVFHSRDDTSNPSTISVNWESEAGTVYGGTLDVLSGKLTVTHKGMVLNGSEEWTKVLGDYPYARLKISTLDIAVPYKSICDRFTRVTISSVNNNQGFSVYFSGASGGGTFIGIRYDDAFPLSDVNSLKTWLSQNNTTVVYELLEPTEIQLTSHEIRTLLGVNNIWSDVGDVSVDYPADTKTYIDDLSIKTVEVSGQAPTITAEENTRYICGEVTSLNFTPSEKGACDVRFTAASISTVLTMPETVKLPDWFDPTLLEANTTYEINIVDGIYGVVMSWA